MSELSENLYDAQDTPEPSEGEGQKTDMTAPEAAPENKPDGEKEGKKSEEIVYDLSLPEGSLLTQADVDSLKEYAKSKGLSAELAREILQRQSDSVKSFYESQVAKMEELRKIWYDETMKDDEIGGKNSKVSIETAKRTFDKYATPAIKKMLDESGFGNHPEVIRIFKRIGDDLKIMNDTVVLGDNSRTKRTKTNAEVFYGDSGKNEY